MCDVSHCVCVDRHNGKTTFLKRKRTGLLSVLSDGHWTLVQRAGGPRL